MTIFKSAKVTELEARVSELEAENATLVEQRDSATAASEDVAAKAERLSELESANAEIPDLNAEIATLKASIEIKDAEIASLTEAATITQDKINLAAADKLAAQGHGEPVNLGSGNVSGGESGDLLDQYENLQGQEKRDFLAKHAVELQSLAKAKSKQG